MTRPCVVCLRPATSVRSNTDVCRECFDDQVAHAYGAMQGDSHVAWAATRARQFAEEACAAKVVDERESTLKDVAAVEFFEDQPNEAERAWACAVAACVAAIRARGGAR